jgi:hypothetical protein
MTRAQHLDVSGVGLKRLAQRSGVPLVEVDLIRRAVKTERNGRSRI